MIQIRALSIFVFLSLVDQSVAYGTPITPTYRETKSAFSLLVSGTGFDLDDTRTVTEGEFWRIRLDVIEDAGFVNDVLTIRGDATHITGPHGEVEGPLWDFILVGNADGKDTGAYTESKNSPPLDHQLANHHDTYTATLNYSVTSGGVIFQDISAFNFRLIGTHCAPAGQGQSLIMQDLEVCPIPPDLDVSDIPEPTSLVLCGTGLLALIGHRRRRRLQSLCALQPRLGASPSPPRRVGSRSVGIL
jgi:hypothetical protein